MRRLATIAAVIAAVVLPGAARGQVTLGARAGYALGLGDVGGTLAMSDWVKGQVPLQVDGLYRVNDRLSLGLYFSYGFARLGGDVAGACDLAGADCTARVTRFGVQGTYALAPRGRLAPWIGANIGYEWNTIDDSNPAAPEKVTFKGWEYLGVQVGADFQLGAKVAAGPFLAASVGRYGEGEDSGSAASGGRSIDDKKLHEWVTLGVRGRFDF